MDDQQFSLSMAQTMSLLQEEEVEQTVIIYPNVVVEVINCPASASVFVHLLFGLCSRYLNSNQMYDIRWWRQCWLSLR